MIQVHYNDCEHTTCNFKCNALMHFVYSEDATPCEYCILERELTRVVSVSWSKQDHHYVLGSNAVGVQPNSFSCYINRSLVVSSHRLINGLYSGLTLAGTSIHISWTLVGHGHMS